MDCGDCDKLEVVSPCGPFHHEICNVQPQKRGP